ncbi:MAG: hypothetical protein N4A33_06815 [Bacteriovoracaceae bacterium]|jgi:Fe-S cluster assembly iron-binding protein IscA|nr:hypothetical protein [Bacteriovoracaceae bacterium]
MFATNDKNFKVDLTKAAFNQIKLIADNDFTLENHLFRLKIGGKGCDGFTYDTGFSIKNNKDHLIHFESSDESITILIDPFTYYYCKEGTLDYILNPRTQEDGFIFTNKNESLYAGKFFKEEALVPNENEL